MTDALDHDLEAPIFRYDACLIKRTQLLPFTKLSRCVRQQERKSEVLKQDVARAMYVADFHP